MRRAPGKGGGRARSDGASRDAAGRRRRAERGGASHGEAKRVRKCRRIVTTRFVWVRRGVDAVDLGRIIVCILDTSRRSGLTSSSIRRVPEVPVMSSTRASAGVLRALRAPAPPRRLARSPSRARAGTRRGRASRAVPPPPGLRSTPRRHQPPARVPHARPPLPRREADTDASAALCTPGTCV